MSSCIYTDPEGRAVFVSGISGMIYRGYATFRATGRGGIARVKSSALPQRSSEDAAQADLDAYAIERGWEPIV